MHTLRLFWLLISRNILAGLVMGLLFGGRRMADETLYQWASTGRLRD